MHLVTLKKTFGHACSKVPNWQEKTDKKATIELRFIARKFKKNFSYTTLKNSIIMTTLLAPPLFALD